MIKATQLAHMRATIARREPAVQKLSDLELEAYCAIQVVLRSPNLAHWMPVDDPQAHQQLQEASNAIVAAARQRAGTP